jgi:hypothetical protein
LADTNPLVEAFARLPRQEQDVVLAELAKRVIAGHNGEATLNLTDAAGDFVGYLFAAKRSTPTPPPMTPAERTELQRRLDNRHEAVTYEEFISLLQSAETAATAQSK